MTSKSNMPEYDAYRNARQRCENPKNPQWKNYGARGIKFLFTSFEQFLADIGLKPSPDLTLDRKDTVGRIDLSDQRIQVVNQVDGVQIRCTGVVGGVGANCGHNL